MNPLHQQILKLIQSASPERNIYNTSQYHGTTHKHYYISNPQHHALIKEWLKNKTLNLKEYLELLGSLYQGDSHEEKTSGGRLLEYLPKLREQVPPQKLDLWLNYLEGWAEVDSLCQNKFKVKEILEKWEEWEKLLGQLAQDRNIHKRRASLVFLTGPVGQSDDSRLSELAFKNIDLLKAEKDILITKAISWLLRSLIRYHRHEVEKYLLGNKDTLPKIAIRETNQKLLTGKK